MLSLLLILIFSMQSAHMAQAAVSPQPVANWNFDDCTARDSSGNNNNGTLDGQTRCVKGAWVSAAIPNSNFCLPLQLKTGRGLTG